MYNVSTEYKNYIKMPSRTLSSRILIGSETYTDYEIAEMSLEGNLVPAEEFTLGATICNKFEATIMTDNKIMANNVIKPYIGLDVNGTVEEVPLGVFNVDDVKEVKGNKQIVAYDNMMKLEKAYFSDLTYPTTIQAVANEIAQKAGVAFNGTLPNYTIDKIEGKTLREAVGIIAGICGGFARINRLGQLEIVQLTTTDISVTADNFFGSLEKADKSFTIKKITAIKEDNSTVTAGTGLASEEITFSNNFITQSMLNNILTTYNNYSYMPLKMEWQGNPCLDVGDIITVIDVGNTVYQIPIMRLKLTYSGGLMSKIESVAKSESKSEYSYKGSISKKVEVLATEQANIKVLMAQKATIEDLEATNAEIDVLKTNKADISALTSINAAISNLQANKANISDLYTINASIDNLQTNKADITQLNAATGRIGTLESDVANIETILSKDVFSELATVGKIVAGSQIIAEGAIGSAQISDLSASKLTAGIIDAAIITVKNLNADNITVGSINGQRIANGAIDNSKIATNANIDGSKLNISSVVTQINKGTTTIQGSKISVDDGTLDVKFSTLKNTVNSYGESISTHSSQISALDNAIKLKVDTQTYNTKMTTLDNSITNINTSLSKATSDISILQGQIVTKVSQTEIDNSINALAIGGRNLLQGTKDWSKGNVSGTTAIQAEKYKGFSVLFKDNSLGTSYVDVAKWEVDVKPNTEYTLSFYAKGEGSFTSYFYPNTSTTGYSSEGESVSAPGADGKITHSFTSEWKKYWIVWKTTSGASGLKGLIPMRLFTGSKGYLCGVKFEEGNKVTDWTPAPEDVQSQIDSHSTRISTAESSITQLTNSIALKVDTSTFNSYKSSTDNTINDLSSRVSSAELKITDSAIVSTVRTSNAYKNDLSGKSLISTINQTAESVTIEASKINLKGVASAIELSADRIKSGTLKLGGTSNIDILAVYDVNNKAIATIDSNGILVQSTKIKIINENLEDYIKDNISWDGYSMSTTFDTVKLQFIGAHTSAINWDTRYGYDGIVFHLTNRNLGYLNWKFGVEPENVDYGTGSKIYSRNSMRFVVIDYNDKEQGGFEWNTDYGLKSSSDITAARDVKVGRNLLAGVISSNTDKTIHVRPLGDIKSSAVFNENGIKIIGTAKDVTSISAVEFFRSDAVTRSGYVGEGTTTSADIFLAADRGDVILFPAQNNKACVRVGSTHYEIWHTGNNAISKSTQGYQTFANGLIIQWGQVANSNATNGLQVSFPKSFNSAVYAVVATPVDSSIGTNATNAWVTSLNTSNFYLRTSRNCSVKWIAVGV